jgi:hypothetical protein
MLKPKVFKLSDKTYLVSRISEVKDENCYIKLFKLLIKENVKYMRNRNGIFFNVGLLSDDVLTKIDNILIVNEMRKNCNNNI